MSAIWPVVLTIAGSDSGGGAGIQADLKTFSALGVYGTCAVTAITSQNLSGVRSIQAVEEQIVRDQIEAVCEGFDVRAVKVGMLLSEGIIKTVIKTIKKYKIPNLVVDPVFAATSGAKLIQEEAVEVMKTELLPLAKVITPNIPEAEFLSGIPISDKTLMSKALRELIDEFPGVVVVLKGGHLKDAAVDMYAADNLPMGELQSEKVANINNHGSGCSFASAIAAFLAKEYDIEKSLFASKEFISGSLYNGLRLSGELRLLNHFWKVSSDQI